MGTSKNRNPGFRVYPGDDARLFRDVDIETEGMVNRLRRTTHDCTPYGFLVDHKQRPYDVKRIADILHLANNRAGVAITEAKSAGLIQTAAEFMADLQRAAVINKRAKYKLVVFEEMCGELRECSLTEVCLMPTMVDQYLETESSRRTGRQGGSPILLQRATQEPQEALRPPLTPPLTTNLSSEDKPQSSVSMSKSLSLSMSGSDSEREISTARGESGQQMLDQNLPMSWDKFNAKAGLISVWLNRRPPTNDSTFQADFEAHFQMSWPAWGEIKRRMLGDNGNDGDGDQGDEDVLPHPTENESIETEADKP